MRPGLRKADQVAGFDRHDRRQGRVEHPEPHRLPGGLDDMSAAAAARSAGRCRIPPFRRVRELEKPRPDRRERTHKAARPQQLPSHPAAGAQKAIEPFLVHFVPMQQTIGGSFAESCILDVLADHSGALLVAAAKEIAAVVMMHNRAGLAVVIVLVGQRILLTTSRTTSRPVSLPPRQQARSAEDLSRRRPPSRGFRRWSGSARGRRSGRDRSAPG